MNMDASNEIYQEFLRKFRLWDRSFDEDELKAMITQSAKDARQRYFGFEEEPVMKKEVYMTGWIREELEKNLNQYSLDYINKQGKYRKLHQEVAKSVASYFSIKGLGDLILDPQKYDQLFSGKYEDREKRWEKLNLPVTEMKENFVNLIDARVRLVKIVNRLSYVDFRLTSIGATKDDYHYFMENIEKIIEEYNDRLPTINNLPDWFYGNFNHPCLICRLNDFPLDSLEQTVDYFADKYEEIEQNRNRVEIKFNSGDGAWMRYVKERDQFEISLDGKRNIRHQIVSLIHELSHVVSLLKRFSGGVDWMKGGKFEAEKEALVIEKDVLMSLSKDLYGASLMDRLMVLRQTIFELEIYESPNQDLAKLYAETFNRCFREGRQERNDLYLINRSVIMEPLKSLPHCLAMTVTVTE
ncbi:MAG: hypothetical protein BWY29_00184 [Microgenomates group bacterium ADurb.Bin238]|jgi:hypothetical protein|nr:MAG: hypothetical protein BWY29_00184 [Microgenomates group bacterium ADurb.Bin238]